LITINLVSAFSPPVQAEILLTEELANAGVKLNSYRSLSSFDAEDNDLCLPMVFILPVRGDMDLLDADFVQLKTIALHPRLPGRPLVFVLHGDRHVWDEVDDTCPIYAKLKAMFFYSGTFLICPEKLDPDSVSLVARHVMNSISTPPCTQEKRVAAIARLLNRRPQWRAPTKHLGFYDGTTGLSLLSAVPTKTADTVLGLVQELELNSLELNHAMLLPEQLDGHRYAARKIDFIGNRLDFASVWAVCPGVEWMNLAANGLTAVDAVMCPSTLQHLYLHKNAIHTLHVPVGLLCKLRSLSTTATVSLS
jgi:hypothetical protein